MVEMWKRFGGLSFSAGVLCLLLAGCGEPDNLIPAGPPGYDPRSDIQIKESDAAEALGEAVVSAKNAPKPTYPDIAPAPPTAKGETKKTASGVEYETVKEGTGAEAKTGMHLKVQYTGTLDNGKKFDSSLDRGEPFSLTLGEGRVIKGWEEGLCGMKVGEVRKLHIPPSAGYGALGSPPSIPPNASLHFDVELMDAKE